MQVTGQNNNQTPQVQYNCNYNCANTACTPTANQTQPNTTQPTQQYSYPMNYYIPQQQAPQAPQGQNVQIPPSASGVTIQIFNPSVATPGAQPPTYNVNAPCYPSNYYTDKLNTNTNTTPAQQGAQNTENNTSQTTQTNVTDETKVEGTKKEDEKKTEKKKIVQLTDDYIKNLENYLNSQEKELRITAAKEVYERLAEDESRKDDKALTALINKMLQDPSGEVRVLALAALEERICTGDDYTVNVLTKMQSDSANYGMDAEDASKILLKMSGKVVEKEVPIKEKKKTDNKESDKA